MCVYTETIFVYMGGLQWHKEDLRWPMAREHTNIFGWTP
jgi:hypothetical protein